MMTWRRWRRWWRWWWRTTFQKNTDNDFQFIPLVMKMMTSQIHVIVIITNYLNQVCRAKLYLIMHCYSTKVNRLNFHWWMVSLVYLHWQTTLDYTRLCMASSHQAIRHFIASSLSTNLVKSRAARYFIRSVHPLCNLTGVLAAQLVRRLSKIRTIW